MKLEEKISINGHMQWKGKGKILKSHTTVCYCLNKAGIHCFSWTTGRVPHTTLSLGCYIYFFLWPKLLLIAFFSSGNCVTLTHQLHNKNIFIHGSLTKNV